MILSTFDGSKHMSIPQSLYIASLLIMMSMSYYNDKANMYAIYWR